MSLLEYKRKVSTLRVHKGNGGERSPHKVAMLLAVMALIESGDIPGNRIYFDAALKKSFSEQFNKLAGPNDKNNPHLPFFHLRSSGFWHHFVIPGKLDEYSGLTTASGPGVVTDMIEYAYLDDELFEFMRSEIVRSEIKTALLENIDDLSKRFEHWALSLGRSQSTVDKYLNAISGSITNWIQEAGITDQSLIEMNDLMDYRNLAEKARSLEKFQVSDAGVGTYSSALKMYDEFLAETTSHFIEEDIHQIEQNHKLTETEKAILVNTRVGQGFYRNKLIDFWGGCAVSGYRNPSFLVASHIKPWRNSNNTERLDPYNGLLLLPNIDKAFDLGYISFQETGEIRISQHLENCGKLGLEPGLRIALESQHQEYLEFHRTKVFERRFQT